MGFTRRLGRRLVLGIAAGTHDAACCALVDGQPVAGVVEERLTRLRHDPRLPVRALRFCLETVGAHPGDVAATGFFEQPDLRRSRQAAHPPRGWSEEDLPHPQATERALRSRMGLAGAIRFLPHHACHAATAFWSTDWDSAAILTLDGVGEWATGTLGIGAGSRLKTLTEHRFPHSLGLFYATITAYLGFEVASGEGKTMGLAAHGQPRFADRLRRLVRIDDRGDLELDLDHFAYHRGGAMHSEALERLLGQPPRGPDEPIRAWHRDLAASAQEVTEEALLAISRSLAERTRARRLCFGGGVALNCSAVGRLRREGPFEQVAVPPAPGDSGAALGAAALVDAEISRARPAGLDALCLGPSSDPASIQRLLAQAGVRTHPLSEERLLRDVVERLVDGQVIGWFEGPCELGPRALGGRSILADPRRADIRDHVNRLKGRERFRPLAPSVLEEEAEEWFASPALTPWMGSAGPVRQCDAVPAVVHADGGARPQTVGPGAPPRFRRLLEAFFERTGCPVLLNTSFNLAGEPIVASAADALWTFAASALDALVLEGILVDHESGLPRVAPISRRLGPSRFAESRGSLERGLYTFV